MSEFKLEPLKLFVVGKTGVGKSAFCNFLFEQEIFESMAGEPVTEGVQSHQFKLANADVIIYDTEGIEVSNANEWENKINEVIGSSYKKTENIHGVFYLINASSARIENFEINLIKKFSNGHNFPVFVILTHEDVAKPDQLDGIKIQLKSIQGINIVSICSVQKNLRGGRLSVSNEYLKKSRIKLATLFLETSGQYYLYDNVFMMLDAFKSTIENLRRNVLREISNANISIFNITEWDDKIEGMSENLDKVLEGFDLQLESMIEQLQEVYDVLSTHFELNPFEDIFDKISNSVDIDFEIDQIKSIKDIQENINILEGGEGFFSRLGAGISLGYKAVTAESTMKEIAEDGIELITKFINRQISETENQFAKESWLYKK